MQYGAANVQVPLASFVLKASVAEKILNITVKPPPDTIQPEPIETKPRLQPPEVKPLPTRFFMDAELDGNRLVGSFDKCREEVLSHLLSLPGVETSIRLVVKIRVPDGVPEETTETVLGNCRDLKISNAYFDP